MTNEEKINRLRDIQRCTPIHTREDARDFEALEAAIEDIETLGEIESRLENVLKEFDKESLAVNRLTAVCGMNIEELTDAFTKGYRLVSPEKSLPPATPQALEQEPRKITLEDVKGYCKPRYLTIIPNELLYELTHPKIKALVQDPCEMTAEEYRQRMIQAFHNADTDELIAICVLPTEKEFEHLEWLLKNHYKKEPCGDAIDRAEAIKVASGYCHPANVANELAKLPPVNPTKTGHWIKLGVQGEIDNQIVKGFVCSKCGAISVFRMTGRKIINGDLCANCGAKMIEPQERSE